MGEKNDLALVQRPPSALKRAEPGAKRILSGMVADALALAAKKQAVPAAAKFRIGEYEWCEPDYRQILIWAKALSLGPEEVLMRLLSGGRRTEGSWHETHFENGRLLKIHWDSDLLPVRELQWSDGLATTHLSTRWHSFEGPARLRPKLPELTHLAWAGVCLRELDLSGCPRLHFLNCGFNVIAHLDLISVGGLAELLCGGNQIRELDLTSVPNLTALECPGNNIEELDLSPVPRLTRLGCSINGFTRKVKGLKRLTMPRLPDLTSLSCSDNRLSSLDLSALPNLTSLDCCKNEIRELDLSKVPLLEELHCHSNPLRFLDIRPLNHLTYCGCKELGADSCHIELIQRPDQHF